MAKSPMSAYVDTVRLSAYADKGWPPLKIVSLRDLAAVARGRRLALGLTQGNLAAKAGVSRDWVNSFESGKPTVELMHVLRLFDALDLRIDVTDRDNHSAQPTPQSVDLDALLEAYQNR
ncbi:MAG TPA: helix-turn-helix domain-containing protein [Acidimicrobiales bacterium]